jgi:hypothetical protein
MSKEGAGERTGIHNRDAMIRSSGHRTDETSMEDSNYTEFGRGGIAMAQTLDLMQILTIG